MTKSGQGGCCPENQQELACIWSVADTSIKMKMENGNFNNVEVISDLVECLLRRVSFFV